jgi:hypothetical protein
MGNEYQVLNKSYVAWAGNSLGIRCVSVFPDDAYHQSQHPHLFLISMNDCSRYVGFQIKVELILVPSPLSTIKQSPLVS